MRPRSDDGPNDFSYNNPPYANRPTGNTGNFNDSVVLDTSQVQRSANRPKFYSRADALRRRIRRGR